MDDARPSPRGASPRAATTPRLKTVAELEMEALRAGAGVVPPDARGGDAATQTAPVAQDTDGDDGIAVIGRRGKRITPGVGSKPEPPPTFATPARGAARGGTTPARVRIAPGSTPRTGGSSARKKRRHDPRPTPPSIPRPTKPPATRPASPGDDVRAYVESLRSKPQVKHVEWIAPAEERCDGPPGFKLDEATRLVLQEVGITKLYSHQKEAIHAATRGKRSVVIATPTASGKSLAYAVPLLQRLGEKRSSRAIVLFPLKALANDQLAKFRKFPEAAERLAESGAYEGSTLKKLRGMASITVRTLDGDTKESDRAVIKSEKTQLLLTNPDSLHHYLLPGYQSKKFTKTFWQHLELVVVDEAHTCRGVFGSHVANVFRRVIRLCRACDGVGPEFICTSATIDNPAQLVKQLTTRDPVAVTQNGAPSGEKAMILWQPPELAAATEDGSVADDGNGGNGGGRAHGAGGRGDTVAQRRSPYAEAAEVIAGLVQNRIRCLAFVYARKLTESVCRDVKAILLKAGRQDLIARVDSYRGGYDADLRRNLEGRLASGEVSCLVCTSALEMGIDVGDLDATVHVGVPETAAAMWQQAGRAGRRLGCSLAVVVACERPLDSFYCAHPEALFRRSAEAALIDPSNPAILEQHLACAAFETPIDVKNEADLFDHPEAARAYREQAARNKDEAVRTPFLVALKNCLRDTPRLLSDATPTPNDRGYVDVPWDDGTPLLAMNRSTGVASCRDNFRPHHHVTIRGAPSGGEPWTLLDCTHGACMKTGAKVIEKVEAHRAMSRVYEGCVYLFQDRQYLVEALDERTRTARCRTNSHRNETTHPKSHESVTELDADPRRGIAAPRRRRVGYANVRCSVGRARVVERVVGMVAKDQYTFEVRRERAYPSPGLLSADFVTDAVWWDLPDEIVRYKITDTGVLARATFGVVNLCVALVPATAMCDARDVQGAVRFLRSESGDECAGARMYLYDTCPKGVGLAPKAYESLESLWERALKTVSECPCAAGCPSCTQAGGAAGGMAGSEKRASRLILEGLLGKWLKPDDDDARADADAAVAGGTGARAEARKREALAATPEEATASERWADSQCKAVDVVAGVGGENDRERVRGSSEHGPSKLSHAEAAQYLRQWPGHRALCPPQASAELGLSIEIAAAKPPVMTREQRLELAARKKAEFEARRREREQLAGGSGAQLASSGGVGAPAGGMFQTASQLHKMR